MEMTTEIEKQLALMQERDGLEWFFTYDGNDTKIWEGDKAEFEAKWDDYCRECVENDDEADRFESWLEENGTEVEVEEYDEENGDWKVYTDSEADDAWDDHLDSYIDDCILPEIDKTYRNYFDRDAWKNDAMIDGRGHSLAGYDGNECEQEVNGTIYYLYRQN